MQNEDGANGFAGRQSNSPLVMGVVSAASVIQRKLRINEVERDEILKEYIELCKISHDFSILMNRFKHLDCMKLLKELSPAEFMCIKMLVVKNFQSGGNVTVTELSNSMLISAPAISKTLRNLEERGIILRTLDVKNRRKTYVHLTELGKEVYAREDRIMNRFGERILEGFGKENAKALLKQMTTLYGVFENELEAIEMEGKHVIED